MTGASFTSPPAMLAAFLAQYYLGARWIPPEIHLPVEPEDADMLAALLTQRRGGTVTLRCPQRGEKARLIRLAATNAEYILRQAIEKRDRTKDAVPGVLHALKRDLRLAAPPRTIACIDISHLHGTDTVASLVYFSDGKPLKGEYRHFGIRTVEGIDDFKSMGEVVTRYFSRRLAEKKPLPDLLLVDGGKGQLSSALAALKGLSLDKQPVAGLAKRLEEVFLPGSSEAQNIPKTSSALHLLQRIRDEAHRFAITHQRTLRGKRAISSALTGIPGIGPARAKALLERFGSVARIRAASIEDIAAVPGIGPGRAGAVTEALRNAGVDDAGDGA
jgi:excinuclease ABC subunit C